MAHNPAPPMIRFISKVQRTDTCWLWTGGHTPKGYGCFSLDGQQTYAHRASYALFKGTIPDGWDVCHSCDTPSCVNPDHLFVGTRKDNIADCLKKGRFRVGEAHGSSILTAANVMEIRRRYAAGGVLQRELGEEFGVDPAHICSIVRGKYWRSIL